MARLLSPYEYGIVASIFSITTLVDAIRDTGVAASVIQAPQIDEAEVARMWGFGIKRSLKVFGIAVACICAGSYFGLSREILPFLVLSSFGFCLEGATSIPTAMLARRLKQAEMVGLIFASTATTAILNLILAYNGFGWTSIIIGTFAGNCIRSFGAIALARIGMPNLSQSYLPPNTVRLSYAVFWSQIVGFIGGSLVLWALAWFFSQAEVGAFSRASAVATIPNLVIGAALVGMLGDFYARIAGDKEAGRALVSNMLRVLNVVSVFWCIAIAYRAELVTGAILGDRFGLSLHFVRSLAFASYFNNIRGSLHNILVSRGDRFAVSAFSTFSLLVLLTVLFALPHDTPEKTVFYFCLASFVTTVPYMMRLHLNASVPIMDLVKPVIAPLAASLVAVVSADALVHCAFEGWQRGPLAIAFLVVSATLYGLLIFCIPSYRKQMRQYVTRKTIMV